MPRTVFPPTPAPSMDIVGKDSAPQLLPKDRTSFSLPPPAIAPAPSRDARAEEGISPHVQYGSNYSLPPPPTRTRKIILMTPKLQPNETLAPSPAERAPLKIRQAANQASPATRKAAGKKQPSSTSQAGKRIARKTAHSVIERRRRSKMNEEFGVLKNMIPACKDQDMHKLAILQASIDYLRYLEQCVTDLKAANGSVPSAAASKSFSVIQQSTPLDYQHHEEEEEVGKEDDDDDEDENSDVEMDEPSNLSPVRTNQAASQGRASAYTSPQSLTISPALDATRYHQGIPGTSCRSGLPSPAIGPQPSAGRGLLRQYTQSLSTSPTLMPASSKEADEEATAALLMLNKDRRNTGTSNSSGSGRGMSVKDLLSS
ncbi:MAG: hypothetical protein Q9220_003401 [cf. Caloplaca sp. 1 TL-2023]